MKEKDELVALIRELSDANGISGFEDDVVASIRKHTEGLGKQSQDSLLNFYLEDDRDESLPMVQLDCHILCVLNLLMEAMLQELLLQNRLTTCQKQKKKRLLMSRSS